MKQANFIPIEFKEKPISWLSKGLLLWLVLLLSVAAPSLHAQATWEGDTDTNYSNPLNWAGNVLPPGHPNNLGMFTLIAGAANAPDMTPVAGPILVNSLIANSNFTIPSGLIIDAQGNGATGSGVSVGAGANLTVGMGGKLRVMSYAGNAVNVMGTLTVQDTFLINNPGQLGLNVTTSGVVNTTSTAFLGINGPTTTGIQNAGVINNGGYTLVNGTANDGVINNGDINMTATGTLAINQTGGDGLANLGNFTSTAGSNLYISNTAGDGIDNRGLLANFRNMGFVSINGVAMNGINNSSVFLAGSNINIGGPNPVTGSGATVGISGIGINNTGNFDTDGNGTRIQIRTAPTSFSNTGTGTFQNDFDADGDCVILDFDDDFIATSVAGSVENNSVFVTDAAFNSAFGTTGALVNNGLISDAMGAFLNVMGDVSTRMVDRVVNSMNGILVTMFNGVNYSGTIRDYLVTGLADPSTNQFVPAVSFIENGHGHVSARLNAKENILELARVRQNFDMRFDILKTSDNSSCATGRALITFANAPATAVACNQNVQVSLNANCIAQITPDMILEGVPDAQLGNYKVRLQEGTNTGGDFVDLSYLNQRVRVEVIDTTVTPNSKCWGFITVEDKIAPILVCRDTTILCNTPTDPAILGGQPTTSDACSSGITFTYADQVQTFSCLQGAGTAPDTISRIIRTWQGTDASGNVGTCMQTITVVKPQLVAANIVWPRDTTLNCADNPSTAPANVGFPGIIFNGDTVSVDQFCLFGLNFNDQEFTNSDCSGTRKILRVWTIFDHCRPGSVFSNALTPGPQLIKINDTDGPVISDLPVPTEVQVTFTDLNACTAILTVPPIVVSDACSPTDSIDVKVQVGNSTINSNGGTLINVPFGTQNVIYTATDDCGNITQDTVAVTIQDNIAPTVICKENVVVALTQSGTAQVLAEAFNNGSYDNCALDRIRVRRMDSCGILIDTLPYSRFVNFECCDVGRGIMVQLGVWDASGNFNSCMVRVQVQDKVNPVITCPPDMTVTCNDDLTDLSVFGPATVTGGSCNNTSLDLVETRTLDNCGVGTITRTWTVPNTTNSCTQTITVNLVPNDSFNITRMPDSVITVQCNAGIDIENLGQDSLQVESLGCQLLAVSYNQKVFNTDGDCKEVLRTWEIIDWCRNPQANPALPGYRLVTQIVKLLDTVAPTFTNVMDTMVVNADHTQCSAAVTLPAFTATDNCDNSPRVVINGLIANSAGGMDTLRNATAGTTILDVPVGTYRVNYVANDGCNNITSAPLVIVVRDNEGPTVFCDDLVTTLTLKADEPMNSDNRGWVTVWASDFNCKVSGCDTSMSRPVLRFPSQGIGLTAPPADTSFSWTFNCATKGEQVGDLWVSDAQGNWDYVRVTINIQDNMNLCPDISRPGGMISGTIANEVGEKVEEVTVNIGGYTMGPKVTGIDGNYEFNELPMNNNYTVAPMKNIDPLNGVSTYDLVLISKHILGVNKLDSPYKQIAADVNRSGSVTAYDLVQLRQLILNITTELPNNDSWRFVDASYQFATENPAAESFSEVASIGNLDDNTEAHFIAVKIGDVNINAIANRGLVSSESRKNGTLTFATEEVTFEKGAMVTADFRLGNLETVEGYQFTLDIDESKVEILSIEEGIAQAANFGTNLIKRGKLTTSWNQGGTLVQNEERMFTVVLSAKQAGKLSEVVHINSDLTKAEGYSTDGDLLNVSLAFKGQATEDSNFALHNNKPNPFKEVTTISFDLPEASTAKITIFDLSGRMVQAQEKEFAKGYNEVQVEKAALRGGGIYFYQLETATHTAKKKMILID